MKKSIFYLMLICLIIGVQPLVSMSKAGIDVEGGGKCPDFEIDDVNGKKVKLSDFKKKVLIIHHLSPGCATCNKQISATMAMREKYGKDNLKVILFIYDGTFNDDSDRVKNRDMVKNIVKGASIEGGKTAKMDFDIYCVWS